MTIDTSTPEGFSEARQHLGLTIPEVARILATSERTVRRWETDETRPVHPTASVAMDWFLDGFRPNEWPERITGPNMIDIRCSLGLSISEMAEFLDAEDETIVKWESDDRGPPAMVQQVLIWLRDGDVIVGLLDQSKAGEWVDDQ